MFQPGYLVVYLLNHTNELMKSVAAGSPASLLILQVHNPLGLIPLCVMLHLGAIEVPDAYSLEFCIRE